MNVSSKRPTLLLTLTASLALTALAPTKEASAAGTRPRFQMPVPCAQTWRASTYSTHWNGDQDAIDLAQRDGAQTNLSDGEPALAAFAGTVSSLSTVNSEHRLSINHGDGWRTDYVHLKSVPPLSIGQQVAQGEMVGVISNSGAVAPHLHYNQMADGTPVRVAFNDQEIATHAGDSSTWGHWGTDEAEELTSLNCAGNQFPAFVQNGFRYQILYKPATGDVKFMRIASDGSSATTHWSGNWGQRWTHIVPFTLPGGQLHLLRYRAGTGEAFFESVNANAQGTSTLSQQVWWAGWTHFTALQLGGTPHLLAYSSLHGFANLDKVNVAGNGSTTLTSTTWSKGWTHFVPYVQGSTQYLLLYKASSGAVEVNTIAVSGNALALNEVWASTWTPGWTHLVHHMHNGSRRLFAYRAGTGEASFSRLLSDGQGTQLLGSTTWTTTWTNITPMTLSSGDAGLFIYRAGAGSVQTRALNAAGDASSEVWSSTWTTGWR